MGKLTNLRSSLAVLAPRIKAPPKIADGIYTSPRWRKFIAAIKRERGRFCQRCGGTNRVIGDHIVEIKDGGAPFEQSNIELLCQPCHNRKTAIMKARRARGDIAGGGSKV
ncbi:HNH endonuclease signature motif containing protein [Maritalea sp.]|uniref:HNH endonuclease signature motif containing protein n=1 Tax=Maritalea sp. TaxID=2003361 RepID=UPI003EF1F1C3